MSHEYALMVSGEVESIVTTTRPYDELVGFYPGYQVVPIERVSQAALERYPYWSQRP